MPGLRYVEVLYSTLTICTLEVQYLGTKYARNEANVRRQAEWCDIDHTDSVPRRIPDRVKARATRIFSSCQTRVWRARSEIYLACTYLTIL